MKTSIQVKATFFFVLLTCYYTSVNAQWKWLHPTPQGNDLNCTHFVNNLSGWAAGDGGAIVKTIDGGNVWSIQNCGFYEPIHGIYFSDIITGYVASGNNFLNTTNGGTTWGIRYRFPNLFVDAMCFINVDTGWVAGNFNGLNAVFNTLDGGLSWQTQLSGLSNSLSSIQINSSGIGYTVGANGSYFSTTNFGATWTPGTPSGSTTFSSVSVVNNLVAYIAGNGGVILKTTNGGINWTNVVNPAGNTIDFKSIQFQNADSGIVSGNNGTVLSTTDGGLNWTANTQASWFSGLAIANLNSSNQIIVGTSGEILKTTNAGGSWTSKQTRVSEYNLNGVSLIANTTLYAAGDNGSIIKSIDSGSSWQALTTGTTVNFTSIAAMTTLKIAATAPNGVIYTSINSGTNWSSVTSGTTENLLSICRASATVSFACGENSTILKSTNGGQTWVDQPSPLSGAGYIYKSIFFASQDTGWVTTDGYEILYTNNGGTNWHISSIPSGNPPVNSLYFITNDHGFAATEFGDILESTDAGVNWTVIYTAIGFNLNKIVFTDAQNGWVFGNGKVLRTADGGISWIDEYSPSGQLIKDAVFLSGTKAIAVGNGLASVLGRNGDLRLSISNTLLCTDNTYTITVNATGTFNPGNVFQVQISDENGEFYYPFVVGSAAATGNTPILITIPGGLTDGSSYRLRVLSTNPPVFSPLNNLSLTVHTSPNAFIYAINPTAFCQGDSVTLYANASPAWTYQWYFNGVLQAGETNDSLITKVTGNYTVNADDGLCNYTSQPYDVLVITCTGINELHTTSIYNAYPNPATNDIHIKWPHNVLVNKITVCDITGRMLESFQNENKEEQILNLQQYKSGYYLIKVDGEKPGTIQVIKN
jgi:photosystem II stability/assembly factor-like uncharacterized protein